jgi:hypothetical protein
MTDLQIGRYPRRGFPDYRELLDNGAPNHLGFLETGKPLICDKAGDVIRCFHDVVKVQFFTPHRDSTRLRSPRHESAA